MSSDWWRGAVLYQIYPRSFADANGDGIGDLAGITARLPYVAALGVDGIWLSPFYPSPMRDFGYDVSDHLGIDPMFGTEQDFQTLVTQAHQLGLKVVVDQVWSHTAAEHAWFEESRASRSNPKADWYVWADARPDGSPPNNWQSWMGGSAWRWEPRRQQYHLHNFLPQMPDLNFHCAAVQDAVLEIAGQWLERGVDGFRLDTANLYFHSRDLEDNPPLPPQQRGDSPVLMQAHRHNADQPEAPLFFERLRALMDRYEGRMAVAEIGGLDPLPKMQDYTRGSARLHTAYSFAFLGERPDAETVMAALAPWNEGDGASAWPSWAFSNHDAPRVATRWAGPAAGAFAFGGQARASTQASDAAPVTWLALLLALRGTLFLYQGEELGLPQSTLTFEQLRDPFGIAHWPLNPGRDGCRTPFPWQADAPSTGSPLQPRRGCRRTRHTPRWRWTASSPTPGPRCTRRADWWRCGARIRRCAGAASSRLWRMATCWWCGAVSQTPMPTTTCCWHSTWAPPAHGCRYPRHSPRARRCSSTRRPPPRAARWCCRPAACCLRARRDYPPRLSGRAPMNTMAIPAVPPAPAGLDDTYPLDAAQVAMFERNGYIKLKHVLSPEVLAYYGSQITRLTIELNTQDRPIEERSTYDRAFLQVMNLWERSPLVGRFVMAQRLARIAAELLQCRGVRLYHDQSLYKEPGGGITPAHADQYYWPLASDRTITAWIPLQAVPLDLGPLGFYARSQSVSFGRDLGISDESEAKISKNMAQHGFTYDVGAFDLGEVSFHLGWTFHKAGANTSAQPRSVMTIIYMDADMRLVPALNAIQANDRDQWCPGAREGEVIDTPKNPVIWSR